MTLRVSFCALLLACSGPQKKAEAEASYLGQQLACVDKFDTRAAIDECRRLVRLQWGIVQTDAKDGGK